MLEVAPGFKLDPTLLSPMSVPSRETPRFSETDCSVLLNSAGQWLMSQSPTPLFIEDQPLNTSLISPLLLEFFVAQAVLAFQVRAGSVRPAAALGRIVLVDYEPWERPDPPVPLLTLLPLDKPVIGFYNRAIQKFLSTRNRNRGSGASLARALTVTLQAGIGILTKEEAFYLYVKLTSLATGAYTQI